MERITVEQSVLYTNFSLVPDKQNTQRRHNVCKNGKIIETFASKEAAEEFKLLLLKRTRK